MATDRSDGFLLKPVLLLYCTKQPWHVRVKINLLLPLISFKVVELLFALSHLISLCLYGCLDLVDLLFSALSVGV